MKHREEKLHRTYPDSLRKGEQPTRLMGDAVAGKRDMGHEQAAAFQQPGETDHRVRKSESDQGRTR